MGNSIHLKLRVTVQVTLLPISLLTDDNVVESNAYEHGVAAIIVWRIIGAVDLDTRKSSCLCVSQCQ